MRGSTYTKNYYQRLEFNIGRYGRGDHKKILEEIDTMSKNTDSNNSSLKLLELGCGFGVLLDQVKYRNKLGVDISRYAVNECRRRGLSVIEADITKGLPFKDSQFDIIVMNELIEHLNSPEKAILEVNRILNKQGLLILTTPVSHKTLMYIETKKTHLSELTVAELKNMLKSNGFSIEKHLVNGYFFMYPIFDLLLFKPAKVLLKMLPASKDKINIIHERTESSVLKLLSSYRRYLLTLGLNQLVIARKTE